MAPSCRLLVPLRALLVAASLPVVGCGQAGPMAPVPSRTSPDPAEARCRSGASAAASHDCFAAGSAYDRGAHGRPLRQDLAIELFVIGCKASPEDPSCAALKNEVISLQTFPEGRARALTILESMCSERVLDLCNDLASAYLEGVGTSAAPARALAVYERTCTSVGPAPTSPDREAAATACHELASLLRAGPSGVPKDDARAAVAEARARDLAGGSR